MNITVEAPDGRRAPIEATHLAPLADTLRTVARAGADAVADWFEPAHRPPVDDVELSPDGASLTLFLFAVGRA